MKIFVCYDVDRSKLESLLVSAFESGGVNYWCEVSGKRGKGEYMALLPLKENGALFLKDIEADNGKTYELGLGAVTQGLKVMAKKYPVHFADLMADNADMVTGDVFVQCALFGEIVYQ